MSWLLTIGLLVYIIGQILETRRHWRAIDRIERMKKDIWGDD